MTEVVIYTHASRTAVRRALLSLPQRARAGGVVQNDMMTDVGVALLDHIQEAFATKSRGKTDETGDKWTPLQPRTIAERIAKQKHPQSRNTRPSRGLTDKQRERWWAIYRRQLARFRGDKSNAARVAWTTLKQEGAKTLIDKYGAQKVDILRDTNDLMNSLTPHSNSSLAVFRVTPAMVEVGTTRPHAILHHKGNPSRNLPQRKLWPNPKDWPSTWWRDILTEVQSGIVELTIQVVREASGQ